MLPLLVLSSASDEGVKGGVVETVAAAAVAAALLPIGCGFIVDGECLREGWARYGDMSRPSRGKSTCVKSQQQQQQQ